MELSQMLFRSPFADAVKPLENSAAQKLEAVSKEVGQEAGKLKEVAKQFEGIFINEILKQMQETIKNSSFDPDDSANEQVHSMYCTFLGESIAEKGGFGVWEQIYKQMAEMRGLDTDAISQAGQLDESA
ncbi:MAG: rod-binding protein [Planctomycetota bacterium]|jgi:Rod binding domain-containing protein